MSDDRREYEPDTLESGFLKSGMSYHELWWRQLCVGGDASSLELEAYILGLLRIDPHQHDLIAQALNEYFLDLGQDHPVAYANLPDDLF